MLGPRRYVPILLLLFALAASGADRFEVASVRSAPPPKRGTGARIGAAGGPGTNNPERFTCYCQLSELLTMAYGVSSDVLSAPDWTADLWFDVAAKVPAGATNDEFLRMQQNLLAERFKLALHRERRERPVYELVVAKSGLKMKEYSGAAGLVTGPTSAPRNEVDPDGFPALPPGRTSFRSAGMLARYHAEGETLETLAGLVARQLNSPVTDATGLKGRYEFTLSWSVGEMPAGPSSAEPLPVSLVQQLGLTLERKRGAVEMLVVDRLEKEPSAN